MSENIVSIRNLSHRYGTDWAIHDINFDINKKGVLGLLGSNGAGKSTTMNILCGVLNQTEGSVFIDKTDLRKEPEKAKKMIGFLPQTAPLYMDITVNEYLTHCAHLRLMNKKDIAAALELVKMKCGISHFSNRLIKNLSGGYRQRVGIAQAIIHSPGLVVLDEPTNGLDPMQIFEVRKLIKEIGRDRAVVFSSHILSEVQATCQEVKMIERGQVVFSDNIENFNNYIKPTTILTTFAAAPPVQQLENIKGINKVEQTAENKFRLYFSGDRNICGVIIQQSVQSDWKLEEITFERSSAEEIFAQLSKKK